MNYELIRSNRKTVSIEIKNGRIIVRAPMRMKEKEIELILNENKSRIEKSLIKSAKTEKAAQAEGMLSKEEINALTLEAKKIIPERAAYYAEIIGVSYGKITIRTQRTRWGSCSSKGNLNFNCLLMLTPPQVIESVIVHELCHLKEMNHSKRFYAEVYKAYPEYDKWNKWLKDNGPVIMRRAF
ncbi:MAG: M48 family metallopeptidase [Acutalibacteraceae bacterium]